jgi:hypothetical protein
MLSKLFGGIVVVVERFNRAGLAMFIVAFGLSYLVLRVLGLHLVDGLWLLCAGPLLALFDFTYRRLEEAAPFRTVTGGSFLYVPVWLWSALWSGLGTYAIVTERLIA